MMADLIDRQTAADLLDNLIGMVDDSQGNDYDLALKMGVRSLRAEYRPPYERILPHLHSVSVDELAKKTKVMFESNDDFDGAVWVLFNREQLKKYREWCMDGEKIWMT